MRGRRTYVFATREDLIPGLNRFDSLYSARYTRYGTFDSPELVILDSVVEVEELGVSARGFQGDGVGYLVVKAGEDIKPRKILRVDGTVWWAVDQLLNPQSILFRPAGSYLGQAMICGEISTVSSKDEVAMDLYRKFTREVTRGFTSIKGYRLGPQALELFKSGMRFVTIQIDSPPEYDLRVGYSDPPPPAVI